MIFDFVVAALTRFPPDTQVSVKCFLFFVQYVIGFCLAALSPGRLEALLLYASPVCYFVNVVGVRLLFSVRALIWGALQGLTAGLVLNRPAAKPREERGKVFRRDLDKQV